VHPFLPLITEEIWQKLPEIPGRPGASADGVRSIMIQPYPTSDPARDDPAAENVFSVLQELVRAVRTIRSEFTIPPDNNVDVTVVVEGELRRTFESHRELVAHLAGTKALVFQPDRPPAKGTIPSAGRGFEVFVHVREAIDVPRETARLGREREKTLAERQRVEAKLANATFVERAPAEVVERERSRLTELAERVEKIDGYLATLGA
jgi:valyl-tRNA synthetase